MSSMPPPLAPASAPTAAVAAISAPRDLDDDTNSSTSTSTTNDTWAIALKLVLAIQSSLDALELTNASFLADLLVAYLPHSDDALYWLARCHFALGRPGAAVEILKSARSLSARFLYARACFDLGKLDDAEDALVESVDDKGVVHLRMVHSEHVWDHDCASYPLVEPPSKASILALVGQVFQHSHRKQLACHCYERALALNPFLWTAYEQLCRLGGVATNDMPARAFSPDKAKSALAFLRDRRPCSLVFRGDGGASPPSNATATTESAPPTADEAPAKGSARASENQKRPRSDTPGSSPVRLGGSGPAKVAATEEARAKRFQSRVPLSRLLQPNPRPPSDTAAAAAAPASAGASAGAAATHDPPKPPTPTPSPATTVPAGLPELMSVLATWALAHLALHQRKHAKARRLVHSRLTPPRLQATAAAHRFLAATFETDADVHPALTHFARAHALAPWDTRGMDKYSSLLWRMCGGDAGQRYQVTLAGLAQFFAAVVPMAPETLVVLGNLASCQPESAGSGGKDKAIELFKRAGQVQVGYAYGWALCGHEYMDMDQLDLAMDAYNRALTVDADLVTAWVGLGETYGRLDQHIMALQCYQHAFDLSGLPEHERYIAHALQHQGKHAEAQVVLESALNHSNNKHPGIKLDLAKTYLEDNAFELAQPLLSQLATEAPHDPHVHYLIAFMHNRLGDKHASLRALMECQAYLPTPVPQAIHTLMEQVENEVELALHEVTDLMQAAIEGTTSATASGMRGAPVGADTADTSLIGLY